MDMHLDVSTLSDTVAVSRTSDKETHHFDMFLEMTVHIHVYTYFFLR